MMFWNICALVAVAWGAWWLTGMDKTAGGESKRGRHFTRALRCVAVLFLAAVFIWFVEQPGMGYAGIPFLIVIPVSIALILRSSLSELLAHGFLRLVDPALHDDRPLDPGKSRRYQDTIAHLIQTGRRDEAVKLCEELKQSGEVDRVILEHTLEFLGVPQASAKSENPLTQAARLRAQGKFVEAEQILQPLLAKNPADTGAAMMLMRLYAQDLRQPAKAHDILRALEKQPHAPASHIEFARRSIDEWSRTKPKMAEAAIEPKAESVDDLLVRGFVGSAVEMLEQQIKARPQDFELQLKLAEVYAVNCKNLQRAEKIVRRIEQHFSPPQIESARARLAIWRSTAGSRADAA